MNANDIRRRLRRILLSLPVLIVGGLVVAWLLFAWLGFEPLLRWAAPRYVADRSGHVLTIAHARLDPFRAAVDLKDVKLSEPDGRPLLSFAELYVNFEVTSLVRREYDFAQIRLREPAADIELRADGGLNWSRLIDAFTAKESPAKTPSTPAALPRLRIRHAVLENGRIDLSDHRFSDGFATTIYPLNLELHDLSTLPDDRGNYAVSATTAIGAKVAWKGSVGLNPLLARGELHVDDLIVARLWPYLKDTLRMTPPEGTAALDLEYAVRYEQGRLALEVDRLGLHADHLVLRGTGDARPTVELNSLALAGGRFDLLKRTATIASIDVQGGKLALTRTADGRFGVQDWLVPAKASTTGDAPAAAVPAPTPAASTLLPSVSAPSPVASTALAASPAASAPSPTAAATPDDAPWHVGVSSVKVDGVALHFVDQASAAPFTADIDELGIGLQADAVIGKGAPALVIDKIGVDLHGVRLVADRATEPFIQVTQLAVEGGHVDLAERRASLARLAVSGGRVVVSREANGSVPLLDAFAASPATAERSAVKPALDAAAAAPGASWHYRVEQIETRGFDVALSDRSVDPPLQATLVGIEGDAKGLSDDPKAAVPVRLKFAVKEGGRFEAHGKVVPAAPSADIQVNLTDLALRPGQPLVGRYVNLDLVRGKASTSGRVRYGEGKFRFEGSASIDDVLVNEVPSKQRVIAWKRLSTKRLVVTPERLSTDEVLLDGLDSKLVIFKDRTVNVARILKKESTDPAAVPSVAAQSPPPAPTPTLRSAGEAPLASAASPSPAQRSTDAHADAARASKPPGFRVNVGRVRVSHGDLDYADLSLALPFAARIHRLSGNIVGLSSEPGRPTTIEVGGQVNEYGLARATGSIDLFDPAAFTDIHVVFKNIEMTDLTPYSATFAGRKIASGKLSLDLEYKVKDRQLAGDNQVVMDQLTLGERVDSPGAMSLPLDLAVALLQDSDGKIELGLPVSGSLDDPKFSYGSLIWKAVVNVITKIVTAPFRALGGLFGKSDGKSAKVSFDAGSAALLPPEREKLNQLAQALVKRAALLLTVHATYDTTADRDALQELRLRRAVAAAAGRTLAPDENPGPIVTADPKTRAALEKLFTQRFGADAVQDLKRRIDQANPAPPPKTESARILEDVSGLFKAKEAPLTAQQASELKGADAYQVMVQRLRAGEKVGDDNLVALGKARGDAIRRQVAAHGVAAERVDTPAPTAATGKEPVATLDLGVSRNAASASSASVPASAPASAPASSPARAAPTTSATPTSAEASAPA